jgi:hypothetical protein
MGATADYTRDLRDRKGSGRDRGLNSGGSPAAGVAFEKCLPESSDSGEINK